MTKPFDLRKSFNVHDEDVTAIIYTLMFTQECKGNDCWYEFYPSEWVTDEDDENEYMQKQWEARLARGWGNCYHTKEEMKKLVENPCTYKEAVKHFVEWLKAKGWTEDEPVHVKIWW
jgi:hypothetical protein